MSLELQRHGKAGVVSLNFYSKIGIVFLTIWSGFNFLLAVGIIFVMTVFHENAPGLRILFESESIPLIEPNALATVNGLAILFNACAASFCFLVLFLIWTELKSGKKQNQILAVLALAMGFLQGFGFVSDSFFGHKNLGLNLLSTSILLIGLGFSKRGLSYKQ